MKFDQENQNNKLNLTAALKIVHELNLMLTKFKSPTPKAHALPKTPCPKKYCLKKIHALQSNLEIIIHKGN